MECDILKTSRRMNMSPLSRLSRRDFLLGLPAVVMAAGVVPVYGSEREKKRFKIGACDWSIGRPMDPTAFELAKNIGLDGVEVSFGEPGGKFDLRREEVRKQYQTEVDRHGLEFSSLAMGVLNKVPYSQSKDAEKWVEDIVDVMPLLKLERCLLAFFGNGDINGKRELQDEVIKRLKRVAPKAEKNGVVLGIESWMNADDHIRILDEIASPSVKVYYDVANMEKQGYDIYKEIRKLGGKRICQFHCKENDSLLGRGKIDFPRVKEAVDEIDYSGWLIIESAIPGKMPVLDAYKHNQEYLRKVFGS